MSRNKPRHAGARWREGAPAYVLDCFDHGTDEFADRYTVFIAAENKDARGVWCVPYLALSADPCHPQGVSLWGEMVQYDAADYRCREGKRRIRWLDLPKNVRAHVARRMET
jgi:hypothetical protein